MRVDQAGQHEQPGGVDRLPRPRPARRPARPRRSRRRRSPRRWCRRARPCRSSRSAPAIVGAVHVVFATIDSDYVREWADLLVRWLHVIAAIAWIGASFYFILLDNHLEPPKSAEDAEAGVAGELWEVHGGGFYHVQKYQVAPRTLPERLAWFKWEAYTTWLSGFALLCIVYFSNARAYLIDRSVADLIRARGDRDHDRIPGRGLARLRRPLPPARPRAEAARARAVRLHRALGVRGGPAVRAARDVHRRRLDDRHDDGRQRPLRDHPGPLGADPREAGRPRARSRARHQGQAALRPQQLPDAAGAAD